MLVVRNDSVVNRVGVVELATVAVGDELVQATSQALQLNVVDRRRQDDDVVTQ